jgi:hypothetical protein
MDIDISKIKPGDTVSLVPLEVMDVSKGGAYVHIWLDPNASFPMKPDQIAAHHPAPRELQVGDRVKVAPAYPTLIAGTVEHISRGKARVIWDNGDDTLYSVSDLTLVEGGG